MKPDNSPRASGGAAALLTALTLLLTACGGGGSTTAQPVPTVVVVVPPTNTPPPPPKPAGSPSPSPPASPSPSPSPSPTLATAAPTVAAAAPTTGGSGLRLALAPDGNEARYRAQEQLAGQDLPSAAVGATRGVSGAVVLGPDGALVPDQSKITVDLSQLASDRSNRDNFIRSNTLQTSQYPNAVLVPREVRGLPWPLPPTGGAQFELLGDLTVHEVTRPTTWAVQAQFVDRQVSGVANTRVKITDFGMTPPKAGPVLSIEDELGLEIEFQANRE